MLNRYLQDRANRRMRECRNHRGSRGSYMSSRKPHDYTMNERKYDDVDYYRDYERYNNPMHYEMYDMGNVMSLNCANDYSDDYGKEEKEYKKDLEKLITKLKMKDRFNLPKEEIIKRAKQKGVNFNDFDEFEFYAAYLMIVSDHKKSILDPNIAILQAQEFFEDDDIAVSPSEKICIYMYKIILGE